MRYREVNVLLPSEEVSDLLSDMNARRDTQGIHARYTVLKSRLPLSVTFTASILALSRTPSNNI